jgi:hypothetical protein
MQPAPVPVPFLLLFYPVHRMQCSAPGFMWRFAGGNLLRN